MIIDISVPFHITAILNQLIYFGLFSFVAPITAPYAESQLLIMWMF